MKNALPSIVRHVTWAAALGAAALSAQAGVTITLTYDDVLTAAQQPYFSGTASFWESVITGDKVGVPYSGRAISASSVTIDGAGGTRAYGGPTSFALSSGTRYAMAGRMDFDTADIGNLISNGSFSDVIKNEMAHGLGFGTLWTDNSLYIDGTGR